MSQTKKAFSAILSGIHDKNISFSVRIKGDHHIFTKADVVEIINIQPDGNKAKPYQVKQVRNVVLKYKLGGAV